MEPSWLELGKREVLREADIEAALTLLPLGTPRHPNNTPNPEKVRLPLVSAAPLSLVYILMSAPFLSMANVCHMLDKNVQAMGITQQVVPFMDWLRVCTISPERSIEILISVDIADSSLEQRQDIRTRLVPPPPHLPQKIFHQTTSAYLLSSEPVPPPTTTKIPVKPAERWVEDLWILIRIFNMIRTADLPDIWHTVSPSIKTGTRQQWKRHDSTGLKNLLPPPPAYPTPSRLWFLPSIPRNLVGWGARLTFSFSLTSPLLSDQRQSYSKVSGTRYWGGEGA